MDYEKIKRLRLAMIPKLSQQRAAELAGLGGKQNWYAIESGERSNLELDTIERIAAVLKVPAKDLLK